MWVDRKRRRKKKLNVKTANSRDSKLSSPNVKFQLYTKHSYSNEKREKVAQKRKKKKQPELQDAKSFPFENADVAGQLRQRITRY